MKNLYQQKSRKTKEKVMTMVPLGEVTVFILKEKKMHAQLLTSDQNLQANVPYLTRLKFQKRISNE